MTSLFTDPSIALEEAEFLANESKIAYSIVTSSDRNQLHVIPKREAILQKNIDNETVILESVFPTHNFNIYD